MIILIFLLIPFYFIAILELFIWNYFNISVDVVKQFEIYQIIIMLAAWNRPLDFIRDNITKEIHEAFLCISYLGYCVFSFLVLTYILCNNHISFH